MFVTARPELIGMVARWTLPMTAPSAAFPSLRTAAFFLPLPAGLARSFVEGSNGNPRNWLQNIAIIDRDNWFDLKFSIS
jgi:hypothetical protein